MKKAFINMIKKTSLFLRLLLLVTIFATLLPMKVQAAEQPESMLRVIVRLDINNEFAAQVDQSARHKQQLQADLRRAGVPAEVRRVYQLAEFRGLSLSIPASKLGALEQMVGAENVQPDYALSLALEDSVPLIGADQVWSVAKSRTPRVPADGTIVAIIDSGVNYQHESLGGCLGAGCRVLGGYDFSSDDPDPMDVVGHGTSVAGIVAANGPHGPNGVAPDAQLLAYKVCESGSNGQAVCYESDVIAALQQAVQDGAQVVNLSMGRPGSPDCFLCAAIASATDEDVLVVASAGNNGQYGMVAVPALCPQALAVGATDLSDEITSFSARGILPDHPELAKPEIVAPGLQITTTAWSPDGNDPQLFRDFSGTSAAAPHVSGAAALLLELHPQWTPQMVRSILINSARSIPDIAAAEQGAGRLDVLHAAEMPAAAFPAVLALGQLASPDYITTFRLQNLIESRVKVIDVITSLGWVARDIEQVAEQPIPVDDDVHLQVAANGVEILAYESALLPVNVLIEGSAPSGYYEGQITLTLQDNDTLVDLHLPVSFWVDHGDTENPQMPAPVQVVQSVYLPLAVGR